MYSVGVLLLFTGLAFIVVGVFLFFYWNVYGIVDEYSGRKAKRQIRMLRNYSSDSGTDSKIPMNDVYSLGNEKSALTDGYAVKENSRLEDDYRNKNEEIKSNKEREVLPRDEEVNTGFMEKKPEKDGTTVLTGTDVSESVVIVEEQTNLK